MAGLHAFLKRFRRLLVAIGRVELAMAGVVLCSMTVLIVIQVILRSGVGRPLTWMEELVSYLLVWLTFLGASVGLKRLRHIKIGSFPSLLPKRWRLLFGIVVDAIVLWLMIMLARYSYLIIPIEGSATTVALPIDLPRSLFFSVALFITAILMALSTLYYLLANGARLVGWLSDDDFPIETG